MQKWLSTARNRQNEKIVFNLIIELSETITMKSSEIRGDGVLISQATAMKKVSHVLKSALKLHKKIEVYFSYHMFVYLLSRAFSLC